MSCLRAACFRQLSSNHLTHKAGQGLTPLERAQPDECVRFLREAGNALRAQRRDRRPVVRSLEAGKISRYMRELISGDLRLALSSEDGDQIILSLHNDVLVEALVSLWNTGERFSGVRRVMQALRLPTRMVWVSGASHSQTHVCGASITFRYRESGRSRFPAPA